MNLSSKNSFICFLLQNIYLMDLENILLTVLWWYECSDVDVERFYLELIMKCNAMGKETWQEQKIIIWKCPQRHRHTRSLKYCREELLFLRISWTIVVFYQGSLAMKAIKSEMRKIRGSQPKYCRAVSLSIWQRATQSKQTLFLQFSDSEFQH